MLHAKTRLRDMSVYLQATTDIQHVGLLAEVQHALTCWGGGPDHVLIDGLALSFYTKPRYTQDVDLLFMSDGHVPADKQGFKKLRSHSFHENITHVEVETLSPEYLHLPTGLAPKVFETAVQVGSGWRVASREALIALKLQRSSLQDLADIESIVLLETSMSGWHLTEKQLATFHSVRDGKH